MLSVKNYVVVGRCERKVYVCVEVFVVLSLVWMLVIFEVW